MPKNKEWTTEVDPATGRTRLVEVSATAKNKFHNRRVTVDGLNFDSQGEANRWLSLQKLERLGLISDLQRQKTVPLIVNGQRIGGARLDFAYIENGRQVYEDFKGFTDPRHPVTRLWQLKHRIIAATTQAEVRISK